MKEEYTVYLHISPDGKRYYGATKKDVKRRWSNGHGYKTQENFWEAIQKYGWNNIQHIIVAKGLTEDEAYWLEEELIKAWDTTNRDKGYNITEGGKGTKGMKHSEESRKKMSEINSGENNPMYGKYGKNNPNYGRHHTEETKKKMSETKSGENNPMYGKRHTEDIRKKIGKLSSKSVICLTTGRIFHSAKEGSEYYNCDNSNIIKCCKGKFKSVGKYKGRKLVWRYIKWNHNKVYRIKKIN